MTQGKEPQAKFIDQGLLADRKRDELVRQYTYDDNALPDVGDVVLDLETGLVRRASFPDKSK